MSQGFLRRVLHFTTQSPLQYEQRRNWQIRGQYAEFEVLSVVLMKIPVLWDAIFRVVKANAIPQHEGTILYLFYLCFVSLFTIRI